MAAEVYNYVDFRIGVVWCLFDVRPFIVNHTIARVILFRRNKFTQKIFLYGIVESE